MKLSKNLFVVVLGLFLSIFALPMVFSYAVSAQTTNLNIALQRGYRTGYSDGYMAGYRDTIDSLGKMASRHGDYSKAERAYNKDYGTIEDYRDGYQQGFESGYDTGFDKKSFESTLPTDIKRRSTIASFTNAEPQTITNNVPDTTTVDNTTSTAAIVTSPEAPAVIAPVMLTVAAKVEAPVESTYQPTNDAIIVIPRDTELMLELQEDLSTERNREGDKFLAKIVSPSEIAGAIVEGRISKITKPGRIKRRSEMSLTFDRIVLSESRWTNFSAILTEVMPIKGDNIKTVDTEGTAFGKSSLKGDAAKIGGATGTGLVIGAVAGGPVGAAVGASVGAAFGVGAVVIQRGKHISLNRNQQLRIKASYESQIR